MTLNVIFDVSPRLQTILENTVAFKDDILAAIEELKAASASEHDQVMAAIAALEARLADVVSADDKAAVLAALADAKAAISGIYEPPAPPTA